MNAKRLWGGLCALALVLGMAGNACAEGFALTDWGARGTGLVGGMVGRADDPSAVAHNPAGITQLPGTQMMVGATAITPRGEISTLIGGREQTTKADEHCWINPHAFLTHQLSDSFCFCLGLYSRFGLGDSFPHGWPGSSNLVEIKLKTFSLNPNIAWKVNENLSLALGVELMGGSVTLRRGYPIQPLSLYQGQRLKGDGVAAGFNAALHYRFNEQWAMGLTYRSKMDLKFDGTNRWDYQLAQINPMFTNSDVNATLHLPDSITFGLTWKPLPNLSFEAGTVYTVWSRYKHLNINMEGPLNQSVYSEKKWKDTWAFNFSTEYKPLDWLALRAGYSYETSPMNEGTYDYMTPTNGRHRMAVGAGFNWDNWNVDVAYGYIIVNELHYPGRAEDYVYPGRSEDVTSHVFALSVGYKF